jgi:biotin carboxyl carrier protein
MTFEVEVARRVRTVVVDRAGAGRFRVTLDGQSHLVDCARIGEYGLSLIVDGDAGTSKEVEIAPGSTPGELLAAFEGRTVGVVVDSRRSGKRMADAAARAHGEQKIVAPMPGRIVRVLVGLGDEVAVRQPVVVVEAMKMENELRSPKAGRIRELSVSAGASVEAGKVLAVIE